MILSSVIPIDAQTHFWKTVKTCLTTFHYKTDEAAEQMVYYHKKKVESLPKTSAELYFHREPFDVACLLANVQLDQHGLLDRYLQIRDAT